MFTACFNFHFNRDNEITLCSSENVPEKNHDFTEYTLQGDFRSLTVNLSLKQKYIYCKHIILRQVDYTL